MTSNHQYTGPRALGTGNQPIFGFKPTASSVSAPATGIDPHCPTDGYIHDEIVCDGCHKTPIVGIRYKCQLCHYFNLCHNCFSKSDHNHSHVFNAHRRPMNFNSAT